jgi:uncharacterized membrane protein YqjE
MSVPMPSERRDRAPMGELVRELLTKITELLNTQVKLVKTEIKVESRKFATAAIFGLVAVLMFFFFILFLGVSLILLFAQVVELEWAAVITTAIFLLIAAVAGLMAMREARKNAATIDVES